MRPTATWPWLNGSAAGAAAERALVPSIARWADKPVFVAWGRQAASARSNAAGDAGTRPSRPTSRPGKLPPDPAATPLPAAGIGYVGLAEVARQRDELDAALDQVTEGIELCRQLAYVSPLAAGLVTLAWIRQALGGSGRGAGRDAGSRTDLAGASRAAQSGPGPAGQAAAGPGRPARRRPLDSRTRPPSGRRPALRSRAGAPGAGPPPARPGPARPGARAAGPAAHRGGRQERTGSIIETAPCAPGPRGQRPGERSGNHPGRDAHPGRPAGPRPGLRRRGPADGRAAGPADRGPASRPDRDRGPAGLPGPAPAGLRSASSRAPGPPGRRCRA